MFDLMLRSKKRDAEPRPRPASLPDISDQKVYSGLLAEAERDLLQSLDASRPRPA